METDVYSGVRSAALSHLVPALCALAAALAFLGGVQTYILGRLPHDLPFYTAHAMSFKVNGNALQTAAFRTVGELPIYGSSELDRWVDNRADAFFVRRPSGFAVFPVGRGGVTSLMIAQKLAAVDGDTRGKKVVIFLSSSWFLVPSVGEDAVATNLGISQLSAWVFGGQLSAGLKSHLARRLEDFPAAFKNQTLLAEAVRCLADPTPSNRLRLDLLSPLGKLQSALFKRFDYGVILWEMIFPQKRWHQENPHESPAPPMVDGHIAWPELIARVGDTPRKVEPPAVASDDTEVPDKRMTVDGDTSHEFADLELLVRVLKERHVQALFISQPLNLANPGLAGVTLQSRRVYYGRLGRLLRAAGYPLRDFTERENDPAFFNDLIHPSAKAWIFYDREIDRFYSGVTDRP